jgi:hypothetical protein
VTFKPQIAKSPSMVFGTICGRPPPTYFAFEDVIENATQLAPGALARVNRYRTFLEIDGSDVVEAKDVICVTMSDEQGVDAPQTAPQSLLTKVSRDIDEYVLAVVLDQQSGAQSLVAGIF